MLEDPTQLTAFDQTRQCGVHARGKLDIARPHSDYVRAARQVLLHTAEPRLTAAIAIGNHVVEQHPLYPAPGEVQIGLLLPFVQHHLRVLCLKQILSHRLVQGSDAPPRQLSQSVQRRAGAHSQGLSVHEVRSAESKPCAARRGILQTIQGEIEVAALERRDQVRPIVLVKFGTQAELTGQRFGDLHFEADDHPRLRRALVHVRFTALQIRTPTELARSAHRSPISARDGGRPGQQYEAKNGPDAHANPTLPC
jgi:hypothetical protein